MQMPRGLDASIAKPFTHLDNSIWLHDRPKDAYRLRTENGYTVRTLIPTASLAAPYSLGGFRRFLDMAAEQADLLTLWCR